ncbi:MAG: metal-dependent hydrolase [Dehalococcoidia bacterium]|nr:metal-dependent hydrolase [Dehalococcoidia bacterium]
MHKPLPRMGAYLLSQTRPSVYNIQVLIFGHIGITTGIALGLDKALHRKGSSKSSTSQKTQASSDVSSPDTGSWVIDYRLVLLGSMLPDIIDKPVGDYFFVNTFGNGRIFAHTLLFLLFLLSIGLCRLWRGGRAGVLIVALCSGFHLILDRMWRTTQTLFWPIDGWSFPKYPHTDFWHTLSGWFDSGTSNPGVYIPEIIGGVILLLVSLELLRRGYLMHFLKSGTLK